MFVKVTTFHNAKRTLTAGETFIKTVYVYRIFGVHYRFKFPMVMAGGVIFME